MITSTPWVGIIYKREAIFKEVRQYIQGHTASDHVVRNESQILRDSRAHTLYPMVVNGIKWYGMVLNNTKRGAK